MVPKTIFGPKSHFSYFHEFSLCVCNFCTSNMPNWTLSRDLSNEILFMSNWHHLHCVWKGGKWKESKGREGISCIWIIEKKRNVCKTNPLGPHFAVRGRKGSRETQIKKWSLPFRLLTAWISTFVIIFYISLPNLRGHKSKNNNFFFFTSQTKDHENIQGKFFLFLFSYLLFLSLISFPFYSLNCNQTKC